MGPKLKLQKKYRISNAEVRSAAERFQLDGLKLQWIISTKTVVDEIDEADSSVLPFHFDFTAYKDLAPYADLKHETVGQYRTQSIVYFLLILYEEKNCI